MVKGSAKDTLPRNRTIDPVPAEAKGAIRMWNVRYLVAVNAVVILGGSASPKSQAQAPAPATRLTPTALRAALADPAAGDSLAGSVRTLFGDDEALRKGAVPKTEKATTGITVAWAIEASGLNGPAPAVQSDDPTLPSLPLQRIGATDIYAGTVVLPKGLAGNWSYIVNGQKLGGGHYEEYPLNAEELPDPAAPKGKLTEMPIWHSTVFAGTVRHWWVYVPAQYTPDKPAAVMVFQDGSGPKSWMPTIFDNMIAKGDIPPVVGIFIDPGKFDDPGKPDDGKSNRSVEYDTLSDAYSQMLLQEILPEVEKTTKLSTNPDDHAIFGVSSGGICAFTVAWNHPEAFRKVDTCVGSFTALQGGPSGVAGGNTYPAIIRKSTTAPGYKPKPIKMFQTDGANDLDNLYGNWPLCNQQIAKALDFAGYEHKFVFGNGFHGDKFGHFLMPTALRYLWGTSK